MAIKDLTSKIWGEMNNGNESYTLTGFLGFNTCGIGDVLIFVEIVKYSDDQTTRLRSREIPPYKLEEYLSQELLTPKEREILTQAMEKYKTLPYIQGTEKKVSLQMKEDTNLQTRLMEMSNRPSLPLRIAFPIASNNGAYGPQFRSAIDCDIIDRPVINSFGYTLK